MSDSVEAHQRRLAALAAAALARGQAAFAAGDLPDAERWLGRAGRVAGGNDTIDLLLATVRLRRGDATAAAGFAALAERHDLREAWIGLAAAHHRAGADAQAAVALGELLAGHTVALNAQFRALADAISAAAGAPGWCGLDADRRLILPEDLPVAVTLDTLPWADRNAILPLTGGPVAVCSNGRHLLGSPVQLDRALRLDGFVADHEDGLSGWAWHPNSPETTPSLRIKGAGGFIHDLILLPADTGTVRAAERHDRPLAQPRPFFVASADLPPDGPVHVVGFDGRDLPGSPLQHKAADRYARACAGAVAGWIAPDDAAAALRNAPVPAGVRGRHVPGAVNAGPATIVVPSYRGHAATLACLASVFANSGGAPVVVVDDAGPEPALAASLDALAAAGRIHLIRHASNRGFPASANAGLRAAAGDVVLLNSDTLVPPGWLGRLRDVAHAAPDIASVTPLSNDATLLSYPRQDGGNPVPGQALTDRFDRLADRANRGGAVDIPTAVGFCMYVRRDALDQVGLLREDVFAQGYAEENDWCMRALRLGWRHVAATGVFVSHIGGQSFGAARAALLTRNLATLNRLHPGYDALIAADHAGPALAAARRRIDLARLATRRRPARSVILITHDLGGGVQRQVNTRREALLAGGDAPIVLRPVLARPLLQGTGACVVDLAADLPNLVFQVATDMAALVRLLAGRRPRRIELHHMLGHDHALMELPGRLGIPYEVHIHDYAWFCPRVSLVGYDRRYCGEPDIAGCEACIADNGRNIDEEIAVADLVARSAADLAGAETVIAASDDTGARMRRHFPQVRTETRPWDASRPAASPGPEGAMRVVGVLGAIGIEKGYDVLLGCARDAAARALNLRFVVIGHTTDDSRLIDTGRVFITGEYTAAALPRLIAQEGVQIAFLPSIWPETWCFTLSEAWTAGLHAVAFDLGAPAERIRRHGGGTLLPLGCRPAQVNTALLGLRLSSPST